MNLAKIYRFTTLGLLIACGSAVPNLLGWTFAQLTALTVIINVSLFLVITALVAFNYLNRDNDKQWKFKLLSTAFVALFLLVGGLIQWM